jgi:hypothetical protein
LSNVVVDGDMVRWRFQYGSGTHDWGSGARLLTRLERLLWLLIRRTPKP